MQRELVCTQPATSPRLEVRTRPLTRPGAGRVLVRVQATSVNPIDAKRAAGYGRRLLRLKGAATFPLVLGNDLAGTVEAVGTGVSEFVPGQRVFGLVITGSAGGAHASHVAVPHEQLRAAPAGVDLETLAVLPYSFTTMWLALRSVGLAAGNAAGVRVLINGASGALGQLALQMLCGWGSHVTAICGPGGREKCLALGAQLAVARGAASIAALPADFDVVLNFGAWDDEIELASRLGPDALGQATTVHPLLGNFDRLGWVRGALASRRDRSRVHSAIARRAPRARYGWTLFKFEREALDLLHARVCDRTISLPLGIKAPFAGADAAFAHVASGRSGRALLLP